MICTPSASRGLCLRWSRLSPRWHLRQDRRMPRPRKRRLPKLRPCAPAPGEGAQPEGGRGHGGAGGGRLPDLSARRPFRAAGDGRADSASVGAGSTPSDRPATAADRTEDSPLATTRAA